MPMPTTTTTTREAYRYIDRQEWNRVLFYTDLLVIAVFMVSLVLLVVNAYHAGYQLQFSEYADSHTSLWRVAVATGFMVGSLSWIFFRFFRNQYVAMQKPF